MTENERGSKVYCKQQGLPVHSFQPCTLTKQEYYDIIKQEKQIVRNHPKGGYPFED